MKSLLSLRSLAVLLLSLWAAGAQAQRAPSTHSHRAVRRYRVKPMTTGTPSPAPDTVASQPPETSWGDTPPMPPMPGQPPRPVATHPASGSLPARAKAKEGFPWPPRPYSEQVNLPAEFFAGVRTLGEADDHLSRVLTQASYRDFRYYALPEQPGFALVTKFEQISYGYVPLPEPGRWSLDTTPCPGFSPLCLARSLVFPTSGYWRVFVFVVTDRPLPSAEGTAPSSEEADLWFGEGTNKLPAALRKLPFTADHYAAVLVYEFNKKEGQPVVLVSRCRRDGFAQLQLVGIRY